MATSTSKIGSNGYLRGPFISPKLGIKEQEEDLPFTNQFTMLPEIRGFIDEREDRIIRFLTKNPDQTLLVRINGLYAPGTGVEIDGGYFKVPGRLLYILYRIESTSKKSNFHSAVLLPNIRSKLNEGYQILNLVTIVNFFTYLN